uniref:Si:busm1-57f23.1 n=1 Tax=Neogobius melanostomus TaxID=47308 RepID=A0A8C6UXZ0_9GOBI
MSAPLSVLITLSVVLLCLGEKPVEDVIKPRKATLLGGWFESRPDSKEAQDAIQYSIKMYNSHSKSKRLFRLDSITAVQSQVTNVINFKINAILGKTKCSKAENHDLEHCELEKKRMDCQFVVAFNHSNKKHEMKSRKCTKLVKPKA